jgi:ubiquinone/menaquinone biosynthesis C-methylase UbiE
LVADLTVAVYGYAVEENQMTFKDLFSQDSENYAKFRPHYPAALFAYLSSLAPSNACAWDCATGNGQAAVALAAHFDRVMATDASSMQINNSMRHHRVNYSVASAEKSNLNSTSIDLITVAQAFHWFDHEAFFVEVKRVLKPQGVLAIWCYELCSVSREVDAVVYHLYTELLGPFWEKERRFIEEGYRNNIFPLREIAPPSFSMEASWTLDQFVGYLKTWSPLSKYRAIYGEDAVEKIMPALKNAWGEKPLQKVNWPISLRVGRKINE